MLYRVTADVLVEANSSAEALRIAAEHLTAAAEVRPGPKVEAGSTLSVVPEDGSDVAAG